MASLLHNIDRLVDKEKDAKDSSEEDCRECAIEVKLWETCINSNKLVRKADSSPGARFHVVLDSLTTPSLPNAKHNKEFMFGSGKTHEILNLEGPPMESGPLIVIPLEKSTPHPSTRCELYGSTLLPRKRGGYWPEFYPACYC